MSFADAVITVNESMRRRLSATSRQPVAVVMNLPDPEVFGSREKSRPRTARSGSYTAAPSPAVTAWTWWCRHSPG